MPQIEKVNEDLLTFTYGSLVVQLLEDHYEEIDSERERESRDAGSRYFQSLEKKERQTS